MFLCSYEKNITFHPSSTVVYEREGGISSLSLDWVMYDEMCQQGPKRMVRGCTCVGDLAVALFTGSCNVSPAIHSGTRFCKKHIRLIPRYSLIGIFLFVACGQLETYLAQPVEMKCFVLIWNNCFESTSIHGYLLKVQKGLLSLYCFYGHIYMTSS
jgi:hypothetical protein